MKRERKALLDDGYNSPLKDCLGVPVAVDLDYLKQLEEKFSIQKNNLLPFISKNRIIGPHASTHHLNYRCSIKYAVRASTSKYRRFAMGLFQPGSHEVVDAFACPTQHQAINAVLADLRPLLESSSLTPYDEANHTGDLRYLCIRVNHLTEDLYITFVMLNTDHKNELKSIIKELRKVDHKVQGASINLNTESGNHIFGPEDSLVIGSPVLTENLDNLRFEISPAAFFQVNPWQAQQIYRRMVEILGPCRGDSTVWELYSGVGQIGQFLAREGYNVIGVEQNAKAIANAERSAKSNGLEHLYKAYQGLVEDKWDDLDRLYSKNLKAIIVNPSRRGLDSKLRSKLAAYLLSCKQKPVLIYLSCEIESLKRDLEDFKSLGLKLAQSEVYDMFPQTGKLEWLNILKT